MAFEIFSIVGKIGLEGMSAVEAQMTALQTESEKTKKAMQKVGMGMVAMGGAILGGMGLAMKSAADFETAMREVNTMMNLSSNEFKSFSSDVQAMASDMGVDAVKAAKALYQAISAGVPKENAIDFLKVATKAAIGGVTDTTTAVDGLTTVINAFKMPISEAEHVADVMFTTVKGGKTTMEELSASLFNVAPIAAASGIAFEEVSAALATMTKQGIPTNVATTSLRQALVTMQTPTADMAAALKDLEYESGQAMIAELGLAGALEKLRGYSKGSNETLMRMFGSVEAGQAVLSLTGDSAQMFAADILAMSGAAGASDAAFQEMEKSAARQMEKMQAAFKDIQITIGNVLLPGLNALLGVIKPIVAAMTDWTREHPVLTKVIVIATAALGALLLTSGSILVILPTIAAGYATLKLVMGSATVATIRHTAAMVAARIAAMGLYASLGLIGVALGAAAIVFTVFGGKSKDTKIDVDRLSESLVTAKKHLAELGESADTVSTKSLAQASEEVDILTEALRLFGEEEGKSSGDTNKYSLELEGYTKIMGKHSKAYEEMTKWQAFYSGWQKDINEAHGEGRELTDKQRAGYEQYMRKLIEYKFTYDEIDNSLKKQLDSMEDLTFAYDTAEGPLKEYIEQLMSGRIATEEFAKANAPLIAEKARLTEALETQNIALDMASDNLERAQGEYDEAEKNSAGYKDELNALTDSLKTHQIELENAQIELGKIQTAYDNAKGEVDKCKQAIAEANNELNGLTSPRLEGMQAFEDKIFDIDQAVNALELEKVQMAEGADTTDIDKRIAALRKQRREQELLRDIQFDPLIRQAKESVEDIQGLNEEFAPKTVFDRIASLGKSLGPDGELGKGLADAQAAFDIQNTALTSQTELVNGLSAAYILEQGELVILNEKIAEGLKPFADAVTAAKAEQTAIQTMVDAAVPKIEELTKQLDGTWDAYIIKANAAKALLDEIAGRGTPGGPTTNLPSGGVVKFAPSTQTTGYELGFATGGIVPGPIGAPMRAIVHGGETIIPVGGVGGVSINISVGGSVTTERDLVDVIMSQAIPQIRNAIGAR
jgi:TP901 family phage tail tape measure protein